MIVPQTVQHGYISEPRIRRGARGIPVVAPGYVVVVVILEVLGVFDVVVGDAATFVGGLLVERIMLCAGSCGSGVGIIWKGVGDGEG